MQRSGLREQSTIALLLLSDLVWGVIPYAIAFALRIFFPLPFTVDFLPFDRIFELRHMLPAILLAEFVTLYFFGFYDLRALRAGFQIHIPKPVEPAELIATVASLAALRRTR